MAIQKNWVLNPVSYKLRPWIWKLTGVNAKGKFNVGYDVYYDVGNANHFIQKFRCGVLRTPLICPYSC